MLATKLLQSSRSAMGVIYSKMPDNAGNVYKKNQDLP